MQFSFKSGRRPNIAGKTHGRSGLLRRPLRHCHFRQGVCYHRVSLHRCRTIRCSVFNWITYFWLCCPSCCMHAFFSSCSKQGLPLFSCAGQASLLLRVLLLQCGTRQLSSGADGLNRPQQVGSSQTGITPGVPCRGRWILVMTTKEVPL